MKGPYQIKRDHDLETGKVLFELVDNRDGIVYSRYWINGSHVIAPKELRQLQARLNTQAMLDWEGVTFDE